MTTTFPSSPYYDDYDASKNFHRILFKPGRAVQARELTQIQTQIQDQIKRFGDNIFVEGTVVLSGQQNVDFYYKFVKLVPGSGGVAPGLVGDTIIGETSGVRAIVLNYTPQTATDPATIFVKYLDSGFDNQSKSFFNDENLISETTLATVRTVSSNATGNGTSYSIKEGVLYVKGAFVYHDEQTILVSKYQGGENTTISKSIGFVATEFTVDENDDDSLLDPALESSNYYAPGGDRYGIRLQLSVRDFEQADDDLDFIEMFRIENGVAIRESVDTEYSVLGDTLARRTFDQSGNFTVRPYDIEIIEHLHSNANVRDGYLTADDGGNADLFVNIISPGKAYVQGYELENVKSRYLIATKAREFAEVNDGTISSEVGNYVILDNLYSAPNLSTLNRVDIYNKYTEFNGSSSGDKVGTARIRTLIHHSGTQYKAYLFDVQMNDGFSFERHAKQIYFDNSGFGDFTANIVATLRQLTGTFTTEDASNVVIGNGTRFISELIDGDFVTIGGNVIYVDSVIGDNAFYSDDPISGNVTGVSGFVNRSTIVDSTNNSYVFELPYNTIKTIDPTETETIYNVKRSYDRTLVAGNTSITAGTDEIFVPYTQTNYTAINLSNGEYIDLTNKVTRSGTPTGKVISFELGLGSVDVRIITTVQKTNSASLRKAKTIVEDFQINLSSNTTARASTISLTRADVFKLKSVRMSTNGFDVAYDDNEAIDVTNRYELDNGQRLTHYDIGSIRLRQGYPKPSGPIRITFDYFNHSSGDYFSVDSYQDIDYKDIPEFRSGTRTFKLRDCIDFRPRIDTNGLTYTNHSEFKVPTVDFITDYQYYLPRIDKIVLDSKGDFKYVEGISSLNPKEPATPVNTMALFVLKQNAYVFDVKRDIEILKIDNKRYTMRDIGRIENRIKNLEYYTTLSLLERETSVFQIKDELGFDRFKNGFIVDNFGGHSIGDHLNPDYSIAMDFNAGIIRPRYEQKFLQLLEVNDNDGDRLADHYQKTGNILSLPYTDVLLVENLAASRVENINPFSVVNWIGDIVLDPPSDIWFDEERLPTLYQNQEGNYNTVVADAQAAGTWGTVWGAWTTTWYGDTRTDSRTGTEYTINESIVTTTNNDVVISKDVIPTMRSIDINFSAFGLKPNTRMHVYFNDLRVDDFCIGNTIGADFDDPEYSAFDNFLSNQGLIVTNADGFCSGVFNYDASYFNFPTGDNFFRLTDSPTNGNDSETSAEALFKSSGELVTVQDQVTATRNAYLSSKQVYESQTTVVPTPAPAPTPASNPPTIHDAVTGYGIGYIPWQHVASSYAVGGGHNSISSAITSITSGTSAVLGSYIQSNGHIRIVDLLNDINSGSVTIPQGVLNAFNTIKAMLTSMVDYWYKRYSPNSDIAYNISKGASKDLAITYSAMGCTVALVTLPTHIPNSVAWKNFVVAIRNNPNRASDKLQKVAPNGQFVPRTSWNIDPLAQTFIVSANPLFLSKVDVFFYSKDNNVPAFLEIRTVVNGNPTEHVVPFSRKLITPQEVLLSDDGSVPTTIKFDGLVYLEPGEYCITLLTNSINYRVWISQVGERDIQTNQFISTQPFVGVLFKSQNASTWTADQLQDLKFRLYRAQFDNSSRGFVDFRINQDKYQFTNLAFDPLEFYPDSSIIKVYHDNNGMIENSTVKLRGFYRDEISDNVIGNIFGIPLADVEDVEFSTSNVKENFYTIDVNTSSNVELLSRGGRDGIIATQDFRYDAMYPAISILETTGNSIEYELLSTDVGYIYRPFTKIERGTVEFEQSKVLPSDVNRLNNLGNTDAFLFKTILQSDNPLTSPLIDLQQAGTVFIRNIINNPTYDNINLGPDIITIAENNDIFFEKISDTTGYINLVDTIDQANATEIIKGTIVSVFGAGDNDGQFRVIDILNSGANILVNGDITDEAAGNTVTITNGTSFITEEAAEGGSALSKYITKEFNFINPSTSINIRLDVSKPEGTDVKFYYKTKLVNEDIPLSEKEFIEIENVSIKTSVAGEFYEIETQLDDLPQFNALVLKIVLLSDNSARVPKASALRVIVLA